MDWNSVKRELAGAVTEGARRGLNKREDDAYTNGFNGAANICVNVLSESIEELLAKMDSGKLSNQEQVLYARLNKLKIEMEKRLVDRWEPDLIDGDNSRG